KTPCWKPGRQDLNFSSAWAAIRISPVLHISNLPTEYFPRHVQRALRQKRRNALFIVMSSFHSVFNSADIHLHTEVRSSALPHGFHSRYPHVRKEFQDPLPYIRYR